MHIPTLEEIRTVCLSIQSAWTPHERETRVANDHWRTHTYVAPTVRMPIGRREAPSRD